MDLAEATDVSSRSSSPSMSPTTPLAPPSPSPTTSSPSPIFRRSRFLRHYSTSHLLQPIRAKPWREHSGRPSFVTTTRSIANFRTRLFIIDGNDMCLCGLLSISHSVNLVICIEVFFALVLLIQSPDLLTMNGGYFYFLGMFDGSGVFFFALHVFACVSCVVTAALLYMGSQRDRPWLVLPHSFWQLFFVLLCLAAIITLMALGIAGKMLLPASIVLSAMLTCAGACEVWWCLLTIAYYRHLCTQQLQPPWSFDAAAFSKNSVEATRILALLTPYRDTLYIVFGVVCLAAWLLFNLWALREFFCPWFFASTAPLPSGADRILHLKLQCVMRGRLLASVTRRTSEHDDVELSLRQLDAFVV